MNCSVDRSGADRVLDGAALPAGLVDSARPHASTHGPYGAAPTDTSCVHTSPGTPGKVAAGERELDKERIAVHSRWTRDASGVNQSRREQT
jgi:hypothetical protein